MTTGAETCSPSTRPRRSPAAAAATAVGRSSKSQVVPAACSSREQTVQVAAEADPRHFAGPGLYTLEALADVWERQGRDDPAAIARREVEERAGRPLEGRPASDEGPALAGR